MRSCLLAFMQIKKSIIGPSFPSVHLSVHLSGCPFSTTIALFWTKFGKIVPYDPGTVPYDLAPSGLVLSQNISSLPCYKYRCFYRSRLMDSIPIFAFYSLPAYSFFKKMFCFFVPTKSHFFAARQQKQIMLTSRKKPLVRPAIYFSKCSVFQFCASWTRFRICWKLLLSIHK